MPNLKHDWAELINSARVELPGSSDAGIHKALYSVLHEFCFETNVWFEDITFKTVIGQSDYVVTPQEPGEIVRMIGVRNANLDTVSAGMPTPGTISLGCKPQNAGNVLTARVAKVPSTALTRDGSPEIPDTLLPLYGPTILEGLLGRMMSQVNRPYRDDRLALYHSRKFRSALTTVRAAVLKQNTWATGGWRFPQTFRVINARGGTAGFRGGAM